MSLNTTSRGKFIVVEGVDGAGKTSACNYLRRLNLSKVIIEQEPTHGVVGQQIRRELSQKDKTLPPNVLAMLFAVDRYYHTNTINISLNYGLHVICDRYIWSSFAYQAKDAAEAKWIEDLHRDWYLPPDHLIYLMVEPEVAARRIVARKDRRSIFDNIETITRTKDRYEEDFIYCRAFGPETQLHIVEADDDMESVQEQLKHLISWELNND